jgi:hypothetical protein
LIYRYNFRTPRARKRGVKQGREEKEKQTNPWFKAKQKERNWIEGTFWNGKERYGLDRIRNPGEAASEIWVRASILAMNLKTALKRA